jgi:hypothetical protein
MLGNAEVADGRLFGERSRPAEISPVKPSPACRHEPDMRRHQMEHLAVGHSPGDQLIHGQVLFFLSGVASNGAEFERAGALATEA